MTYASFWSDLRGVTVTQRWIDVRGVRTRVLETGRPGADALVFIHGTGGHAEAYTRNLAAHGEHFHTYSIDMVGHGFSDTPERAYEIADYVVHLKDFLDVEGIAKASISGESLGGWIAARFALTHPDRIHKLVLNTSGGYSYDPEVMARIKTLSLAAVENASWDTVKKRLEFLMADPATVTDDLVATRLAVYQRPGYVQTMRRILCLQEPEIRRRNLFSADDWRRVAAPTLVVWTTHDPTAPASVGEEIATLIPGAKFVLMENCGHWPQFEDAATFNRIHLEFLQAPVAVS